MVCFKPHCLLIRKVWVPVMHHALQSALESGQQARIVQIDFSAAFDRVNDQGILYWLCSVGIWGSVLSILTQCLSNRSQHVMVDGCQLVGVNWLMLFQECRRAVFWAHYCSFCTHRSFFQFWRISWSVMLIALLWWPLCRSPGVRVKVSESLVGEIGRVSEWCDLWGMKLNVSKTKTMIVSRSRTMHPQSPPLTIGRTVLKESDDLVTLVVTFDSKLTFEKHLRLVSRAASRRLGILRKSWRVFHDRSLIERCLSCSFWSTVLQCGDRLPIHTKTAGPCSRWCLVPNWGCVWVRHYWSSIGCSSLYAV